MTASDDLWAGIEALDDARPHYVDAATYYDNTRAEVFSSMRVQRAISRTGVGFGINFIATVVDAVVDRLQLAAVTSSDQEQAELLQVIWDQNLMEREAQQVAKEASEYGDTYVIVLPSDDPETAAAEAAAAGRPAGVDIFCNDPLTVRIIYDAENPRLKAFAIKRWGESWLRDQKRITVQRAELYYDDHAERWTTKENSPGTTPGDWIPWLPAAVEAADGTVTEPDADAWKIPHDFGKIPVFHFRNAYPYGQPEHERGYGAQNAINKLIATHMSTVDYQGFPQRYGLTEAATTDTSDLDPGDFDDDLFPPDPAAGPSDSGDDSNLKSGPGEMQILRGFKEVGQFNAAQPSVFFDPIEFNVRAMAQCTTTPLHLFDPTGDQPSGESVRAQDAPFTRKVRDRQAAYGSTWQDVFAFALHLLKIEDPQVDVRWHAAETVDDKDSWDTARIKSDLGVPISQILLEAGYSTDQVGAWLRSPTDDSAEVTRRLADLASLSETLQRLGTAVTLGAIDQGQVQALVGPVVDALTGRPVMAPVPPPELEG